ncbi:MAG TPA: VWA domain-containing protein [Fredinandcohnia sp.]|nr:VWA domain-containing protein [Fredinandcohnia sp.]
MPTKSNQSPPTANQLVQEVKKFAPDGGTPIGAALEDALAHLSDVRKADTSAHCRPYAVVLLTDGQPDCPGSEPTGNATKAREAVEALRAADIPTYVVGFGADANTTILDDLARRGGTARTQTGWCLRGANGACSEGRALYANDAHQLLEVLKVTFEEIKRGQYTVAPPMVGTVPQSKSEYDRVSNNFMVYTAFEVPDYKGRIFGIRLFEEEADEPGVWKFTDLSKTNEKFSLTNCGSKDNPCVFEAGSMLQKRTAPRKILFSTPAEVDDADNQLVLTMGDVIAPSNTSEWRSAMRLLARTIVAEDSPLRTGVEALGELERTFLEEMASGESEDGAQWRGQVASWIEGSGRPWKLGDMYHSAVAIVTTPPYTYRGYGYPVFKGNYRDRPAMVYVGANDGQIHAFFASDDHFPEKEGEPRWRAGEEAWSYVPFNMFAKVTAAALKGETRVWSQDLSCRVDDVVAYPTATGEGTIDCDLDPEHEDRGTCGWRTVLICGQGWGGSWYVAIDITDPFEPRPMWEATHFGNGSYGLGRTWAVPSVGPINLEVEKDGKKIGVPTWVAIYGSGYNTGMLDYDGNHSAAYRYLNMPFAGPYPEHGAGIQGEKKGGEKGIETSFVFVQDVVTGKYLKVFPVAKQYGITADIPLVGTYDRFHVNVGYFGGWEGGKMGRLFMPVGENGLTKPDLWGICPEILAFSQSKPLTSRPSAYSDPYKPNEIFLFVGSGLDPGSDPDQQSNQGKMWEFQAFRFEDFGGAQCPKINNPNICTKDEALKNIFNDGGRLIAPPTLAVQRDQSKWLTFTTWKPEKSKGCGDGTAFLYCLDVTAGESCTACGNLDSDEEDPQIRVEVGSHKSQTPVVADGRIIVIGDEGVPTPFEVTDGSGNSTAQPNQNAPKAMILSWREIF